MLDFKLIKDLLSDRSQEEIAAVAAYLLAPMFVMFLAVKGVYTPGIGLDFAKPVAVSELLTEVSPQGKITEKKGVALVLEPTDSEYQIPIQSVSSMWISLNEEAVRSNAGHLFITNHGFNGKSPLLGISDSVTVIVQGTPGTNILVPGGTEKLSDWRLQSRRSLSLVSSALLACVFAFGMSLATGLPSIKAPENSACEVAANPDKH